MRELWRRVVAGAWLMCHALWLSAAEPPPEQAAQPPPDELQSPQLELNRRLSDPARRAALRAEILSSYAQYSDDLTEVTGIEPELTARLFTLLVDQHLRGLDEANGVLPSRQTPSRGFQSIADLEAENILQVRTLLGAEAHERYLDYVASAAERTQMRKVNERLPPQERLSREQQRGLMTLFVKRNVAERSEQMRRFDHGSPYPLIGTQPSAEEQQRRWLVRGVESAEAAARLREQSAGDLTRRAAVFLSATQLAALRAEEAAGIEQAQRSAAERRREAGFDPQVPVTTAEEQRAKQPKYASGNIRVALSVEINRNAPAIVHRTVKNGRTISFLAPEDLFIEATPTLFDDGTLEVLYSYYEQGRNGKRLLHYSSLLARPRAGDPTAPATSGSSFMVTGRTAYSTHISVWGRSD